MDGGRRYRIAGELIHGSCQPGRLVISEDWVI
jgi:hypothetical protein